MQTETTDGRRWTLILRPELRASVGLRWVTIQWSGSCPEKSRFGRAYLCSSVAICGCSELLRLRARLENSIGSGARAVPSRNAQRPPHGTCCEPGRLALRRIFQTRSKVGHLRIPAPKTHRRAQRLRSEARNAKKARKSRISGIKAPEPSPICGVLWVPAFRIAQNRSRGREITYPHRSFI